MTKDNYKLIILGKGEVLLYDFGTIKIHNYSTNDPLDDQALVVEKNGHAVIIENPSFITSGCELTDYLEKLGLKIAGKLLSYHMAGAQFLPSVPAYATKKADESGHTQGAATVKNFVKMFGNDFSSDIDSIDHYIEPGVATIGNIDFGIIDTDSAFDIEIPEAGVLYTHMLGHGSHSIVPGAGGLRTLIKQLREYHANSYKLIFSSHHAPEDSDDLLAKISYLQQLKKIVKQSKTANAFKDAMHQAFPNYTGENYLDMTTNFFFSKE